MSKIYVFKSGGRGMRRKPAEAGAAKGKEWLGLEPDARQGEEERRSLGDRWFRQEYLCEFLEADDVLFRREVVERAVTEEVNPLFWIGAGWGFVLGPWLSERFWGL